MYPVLKIMHMLNFLDTFSMGITKRLDSSLFLRVSNFILIDEF